MDICSDPSRNPLKSGQCFLHNGEFLGWIDKGSIWCRNPLKSGQCFLLHCSVDYVKKKAVKSQSPQIGSMFLTESSGEMGYGSNHIPKSQSPQIGSMFLTQLSSILVK